MSEIKITDTPISNYDALCNFCRYVDGRVKFIRTKTGDDTDVYDFCRNKCKEKCGVDFPEKDDGSMIEEICFNCSGIDCLIYLLYTAAVQAAELREHIKNHNSNNGDSVKHGHWLYKGIANVCSICGKSFVIEQGTADENYCIDCGAKMDGKE